MAPLWAPFLKGQLSLGGSWAPEADQPALKLVASYDTDLAHPGLVPDGRPRRAGLEHSFPGSA